MPSNREEPEIQLSASNTLPRHFQTWHFNPIPLTYPHGYLNYRKAAILDKTPPKMNKQGQSWTIRDEIWACETTQNFREILNLILKELKHCNCFRNRVENPMEQIYNDQLKCSYTQRNRSQKPVKPNEIRWHAFMIHHHPINLERIGILVGTNSAEDGKYNLKLGRSNKNWEWTSMRAILC